MTLVSQPSNSFIFHWMHEPHWDQCRCWFGVNVRGRVSWARQEPGAGIKTSLGTGTTTMLCVFETAGHKCNHAVTSWLICKDHRPWTLHLYVFGSQLRPILPIDKTSQHLVSTSSNTILTMGQIVIHEINNLTYVYYMATRAQTW